MSKKYFYPVIFEPEEVGVSVYVPDIPGCNTQGDSLEEALEMVQEVIGLMLEGKKPEEYPQASKPNEINLEGSQFVMMVAFDKLAYDKKYNAKAVKKTLSIPAWVNNLAIDNDINFSNLSFQYSRVFFKSYILDFKNDISLSFSLIVSFKVLTLKLSASLFSVRVFILLFLSFNCS